MQRDGLRIKTNGVIGFGKHRKISLPVICLGLE